MKSKPVNFNTIKTSLKSVLGSYNIFLNYSLDLLNGHHDRWSIGIWLSSQSISQNWDSGGANCGVAIDQIWDSRSSHVPKLAVNETTLGVNGISDILPTRNLALGEDTWNTRITSTLKNWVSLRSKE